MVLYGQFSLINQHTIYKNVLNQNQIDTDYG